MINLNRCENLFESLPDVLNTNKSVVSLTIGSNITIEDAKLINKYKSWIKI